MLGESAGLEAGCLSALFAADKKLHNNTPHKNAATTATVDRMMGFLVVNVCIPPNLYVLCGRCNIAPLRLQWPK